MSSFERDRTCLVFRLNDLLNDFFFFFLLASYHISTVVCGLSIVSVLRTRTHVEGADLQ